MRAGIVCNHLEGYRVDMLSRVMPIHGHAYTWSRLGVEASHHMTARAFRYGEDWQQC